MKRYIRPSLIMSLLLAAGFVQAQNINTDVEPQEISSPQRIDVSSGTAIVKGTLGNGDSYDYFAFDAKAGDVVTIDIDGAATTSCPASTMSLDTSLALYQSGIDANGVKFPLLYRNIDGDALDAGSVIDCDGYNADAYINQANILADGTYIVAVAAGFTDFGHGGTLVNAASGTVWQGDPSQAGSYTLIISGVTPAVTSTTSSSTTSTTTTAVPVASTTTSTAPSTTTTTSTAPSTTTTTSAAPATTTTTSTAPSTTTTSLIDQISIDIMPGQAFTRMNPNANGKFPVALLSSPTFNAVNVDTSTLTFGRTGRETGMTQCTTRDVNRDGLLDLVCHVDNQKTGYNSMTVDAAVMGKTKAGRSFTGHGTTKTISGGKKIKAVR